MGNDYFEGDIINGSDKQASTSFPYYAFTCLSSVDSILGFLVHSLLSVIRLMAKTHLIFMSSMS